MMFHQDQRRIASCEPDTSGGPDPLAANTVGKRSEANLPGNSCGTDRAECPSGFEWRKADFGKVFRLVHLHCVPSEQPAEVGDHDPPESRRPHSTAKSPLDGRPLRIDDV